MNDNDRALADYRLGVGGLFLREAWYYALAARELKPGAMCHRTLLGEPVLLGRDRAGQVFALRDTCPHRGTLLSRGRFDGREIACSYHGWRFATDGRCTAIPSQTADQRPQPGDIRTQRYAVAEDAGNIWIYMGKEAPPACPRLPVAAPRFQLHLGLTFDCNVDLAVIGLMDPAHGAFVHGSSLWRRPHSIHEKHKTFAPLPASEGLGWRMERHPVSRNSRAYRLFLGGTPETEISYALPAVRIEHAQTRTFYYLGLTACTPVTSDRTAVHHVMYWNVPGGALMRPVMRRVAHRFLDQDRRAVMAMEQGLAFAPSTMLVQDADAQTRWYYRLKREALAAQAEGRAPQNPLERVTLKWRS